MRTTRPILLSLTFAIALTMGVDAWAQQGRGRGDRAERPQDRERSSDREQDTLSDSVRRVVRDTRGQVLSAERVPFDGREMHRVKVLDNRGRVRVYMDDPYTRDDDRRRPERRPPTRDDDD